MREDDAREGEGKERDGKKKGGEEDGIKSPFGGMYEERRDG